MADDATPLPYVGARMPDGTIYAGISPDTQTPLYATPCDALIHMDFNTAASYAANLTINDKHDFRLPTDGELMMLFNAHATIGGFTHIPRDDYGLHWSSTQESARPGYYIVRSFRTGGWRGFLPEWNCLLRCVRTDPPDKQEPEKIKRAGTLNL